MEFRKGGGVYRLSRGYDDMGGERLGEIRFEEDKRGR